MSSRDFLPATTAPAQYDYAYWFIFDGFRLYVLERDGEMSVPYGKDVGQFGFTAQRTQFVGWLRDEACFSAEVTQPPSTGHGNFYSLRQLYYKLEDPFFWIAGRAVQLVDWDRTHQFCGKCGAGVVASEKEHVKICPSCDHRTYPRITPAVIVAVTRGDTLLLAHNRHHPPGLYTVLAGFVEAGETLEETIRREIKEEVGIDVDNIRYFGSQSWPFPNSLMLGFTAEWAGGEFVFEDEDIETAEWFSAEKVPHVTFPKGPSISNALIEDWLASQQQSSPIAAD